MKGRTCRTGRRGVYGCDKRSMTERPNGCLTSRAAMRQCEREGCTNSLEGMKANARFCSPTCRTQHWQDAKGVRVGYVRVRPRKRYPRTDWKGAYEDACDAIQILLERNAER